MDLGRAVRRHHASARRDHPGPLAGQQRLYAWDLPRHRPDLRRRELDRARLWTAPRGDGVAGGLAGDANALDLSCRHRAIRAGGSWLWAAEPRSRDHVAAALRGPRAARAVDD